MEAYRFVDRVLAMMDERGHSAPGVHLQVPVRKIKMQRCRNCRVDTGAQELSYVPVGLVPAERDDDGLEGKALLGGGEEGAVRKGTDRVGVEGKLAVALGHLWSWCGCCIEWVAQVVERLKKAPLNSGPTSARDANADINFLPRVGVETALA